MSWVDDNKGAGPWAFTERGNVFGYLNNPLWSAQQDAIDFCEDQGLVLDQSDQHDPCGHWHKAEVTEEPFPAGKWVAAMQQPGTPYIYVYDILQKAVIRIDTSEIPVFVSGRLELESTYDLDYDMGRGNPGAQRGGYCMNKDGTRIWYLFTKSDGDRSDAELIEVDISKTVMRKVGSTLFLNLVPSEAFPSDNNERINDGCSDDTHTYWCTNLIAGRIIKIQNSDHSIIDDHTFNYPIEACSGGFADESITTIDVRKNTGKLYWVYCRDYITCVPAYNACRHFIRADLNLVGDIDDVICGSGVETPIYQNMIRIYSDHILHQLAYHTFFAYLIKRGLDCIEKDEVTGTNGERYACTKSHFADLTNKPITGIDHATYWAHSAESGGNVWSGGQSYNSTRIKQDQLQNILGVKNGYIFTLMHIQSANHPGYLYCIKFSDMSEMSNLDVSYYAGQIHPPGGYDWDQTSVSAMNYQTGVIAIFRYNNVQERNYVGCFNADSDLGFLCDVPLYSIKHGSDQGMTDEPQVWVMPGDDVPEPADPSPAPVSPGPGGAPCTGTLPELSQNPISVSVTEGSDAANRNIRVTDNCNVSLAFQVEEVNNNNHIIWINSPAVGNSGNGALNIKFNTVSMSAGSYAGSIVISTALGNLTLNINLVVTSSPAHGEASGITLIRGDTYRKFDFRAGEVKLFKFKADSGPVSPTLAVVAEVMSHYGNQNGKLHLMARYAGQNWETAPPNDNDYADIQTYIGGDWTKGQGIYNGIYYFMTKTLVKRMYINLSPQVIDGCFYFWIKNYGGINLAGCMVHFQVRE